MRDLDGQHQSRAKQITVAMAKHKEPRRQECFVVGKVACYIGQEAELAHTKAKGQFVGIELCT